ncbi:MAG: alanine racemase C-terminal domain-containing protein [Candidatus Fonsibacter sp.]
MIVDVTKGKNKIKIGDHLELFGKNLNLDEFAGVSQTSPYDIITSVSERCERVYLN